MTSFAYFSIRVALDLSDSHPFFRRGYKHLCDQIRRPSSSKKTLVSASTKFATRLQGDSIQAILSDIVIVQIDRVQANKRQKSSLETSRVHSVTNEDLSRQESRGRVSISYEADDDDISIGTIDCFSNIETTIG